jgi:hypothetical protein
MCSHNSSEQIYIFKNKTLVKQGNKNDKTDKLRNKQS